MGRFGDAHAWRQPVWVSNSQPHFIKLIAIKAPDRFVAKLLFGEVDKGTSFENQNLGTIDGPNLVKQVGEHGLGYGGVQVSHPDRKQLQWLIFGDGLILDWTYWIGGRWLFWRNLGLRRRKRRSGGGSRRKRR